MSVRLATSQSRLVKAAVSPLRSARAWPWACSSAAPACWSACRGTGVSAVGAVGGTGVFVGTDGVGVLVGSGVIVGVSVGSGVSVAVGVTVGCGVFVAVGVIVGSGVAVEVLVAVGVVVGVGVLELVVVGVPVGVTVVVSVLVGVGVGVGGGFRSFRKYTVVPSVVKHNGKPGTRAWPIPWEPARPPGQHGHSGHALWASHTPNRPAHPLRRACCPEVNNRNGNGCDGWAHCPRVARIDVEVDGEAVQEWVSPGNRTCRRSPGR